jgi:hypothetical protein
MAHRPYFDRCMLVLLVVLMGLPSAAWAQGYATVGAITQPDARGRWSSVEATAAAARIRGDVRTPLRIGLDLQLGDIVQTDRARVRLDLPGSETMNLSEGADITLAERSVLQRMGEVYYQVRDAFRVDYGTVQTAVEGTEFSVSGTDGAVRVAVTEGAVRVSSGGESVRVRRGEVLSVAQSAVPSAPTKLGRAGLSQAMAKAWTLGRPRLKLGLLGGGTYVGSAAEMEIRGLAGVGLLPGLSMVAQTGIIGGQNTRVPLTLGLETSLGGIALGGSAQATVENKTLDCGGRQVLLHLGGAAHARFELPLSRRLTVLGQVQVGGGGGAIQASGLAGLGLNL